MRSRSLFWGFLLLIVGILFLLENIGIIHVRVWNILWPIFLIALGIRFILGRYIKMYPQSDFVNIPLESSKLARIKITHVAGRLNIIGGADAGYAIQGTFTGGVDYTAQHDGDCLDARMKTEFRDYPFFFPAQEAMNWSLKLTNNIPLSLELETGANNAMVNLHDVKVSNLSLKTGASLTDIRLPSEAGFTQVDVESGAASLNIHIPKNVAANIKVGGGLSSVKIDQSRFPKRIDGYQSLDFDEAINKVNLNADIGVGSLVID